MASSLRTRLAIARSRLAHRGRHYGGMALGGVKPLAFGAATGAAAQVVGQMAREKINFVGQNWYGEALVLGAASFLLRKRPLIAHALAGAAGYSATLQYRARSGGTSGTTGALFEPGTAFAT